jgi:AAA15 family ATPase/GTPase
MPPVKIDRRESDKSVTYNKQKNRLDTIAGNIYEDETLWRLILWANADYFYEYDIPDNTVIRVPYPMSDVINEVQQKIADKRNKA